MPGEQEKGKTIREEGAAERERARAKAIAADEAIAKAEQAAAVVLTVDDVRKWINPLATEAEAYVFAQLCKAEGLNPYLKEAYLIKYSQNEPASMVVDYKVFLRRAELHPAYNGFSAGVIVVNADKKVDYREGAFYMPGEQIVGGWCEVYRTDRSQPTKTYVAFDEYVGRKKDGTINKQWMEKPGTMIRKVPVGQAHRDAFPHKMGRLYLPEEFGVDQETLPSYEVGKHPTVALPEGAAFRAPERKAVGSGDQAQGAGASKPPAGGPLKIGADGLPSGDDLGVGLPPAVPGEEAERATEQQMRMIAVVFNKLGVKDDAERHAKAARVLGVSEVASFKDLGKQQASFLITFLDAWLQRAPK